MTQTACRHLILILGDQLDEDSAAFDGFDAAQDVVLMIEAREESTHVWSHKTRTVLFLSAMRHFAATLRQRGWRVAYRAMDVQGDATLADGLRAAIEIYRPERVLGIEPGDMRVRLQIDSALKSIADSSGGTREKWKKPSMEWREDRHFLCTLAQFRHWAGQSASLRMEFFYRSMRQQYKVLMDGGKPTGGKWNFDAENRKGFGKAGPQDVPRPPMFEPDAITREVMALVEQQFGEHPGDLHRFDWPVTREQALVALNDFIAHRLPDFGKHQDAMWTGLDFGWHALLSSSLNLKLLNPLEVVHAAENAYHPRDLDLANGYSHHIQRLMVTGMFGVTAQIIDPAR